MHHYATGLEVLERERVLRLWFNDGSVKDIDLVREAQRGPAFAALADMEYVRGVRPVNHGHILEFPDGVTWSVEVCWQEGRPVDITDPVDAVPVG